jgi:hypothetical protein
MRLVQNPRAGDTDTLTAPWRPNVRAGALPPVLDPFPFPAAGLVGGHDFDDERSVMMVPVTVVQEIAVTPVHGEAHVHIAVVLPLRKPDHAGGADAAPEHT